MKFEPYTLGTELTSIPTKYNEEAYRRYGYSRRNESYYNILPNTLKKIKKALKEREMKCHRADVDGHCIEVSSPKFYTYKDFRDWCVNMRKIFAENDCKPKHPQTVCGGAHLHVGKIPNDLKIALAKDMIMRPCLPWVFGEPDESGAMDVLINQKKMVSEVIKARKEYPFTQPAMYASETGWVLDTLVNDPFPLDALYRPQNEYENYWLGSEEKGKKRNVPDIIYRMDWSKDYMFRMSDYGTVEFRFFEMTPTWEEQKLQVEFALRYIEWIRKRMLKGDVTKVKLFSDAAVQEIPVSYIEKQFNFLCDEIGVDSSSYKVFLKRNLYPRWEDERIRQ